MQQVKSTLKNAKISAFKIRDIARAINGMSISQALDILQYTPKKGAVLIRKTLCTAIADAEHNFHLNSEDLIVLNAAVDEGPTINRFMPRARGSASPIRKRSSHITVILSTKSPS